MRKNAGGLGGPKLNENLHEQSPQHRKPTLFPEPGRLDNVLQVKAVAEELLDARRQDEDARLVTEFEDVERETKRSAERRCQTVVRGVGESKEIYLLAQGAEFYLAAGFACYGNTE